MFKLTATSTHGVLDNTANWVTGQRSDMCATLYACAVNFYGIVWCV